MAGPTLVLRKVIPVEDAISVVRDGDVLAVSGYGGHGVPEALLVALEQRFLATSQPRELTLVHATGQGDGKEKGLNHLAHEGLLRRVIGGYFGLTPKIGKLIQDGRIEAYNFPEGVITHLYRDIAAGKPGTISRVGLGTFVDPRIEGGRMNRRTTDDLVEVMSIGDEEYLFYKARPMNVAFIRGTTADPDGNVTMEKEALLLETLALAMATRQLPGTHRPLGSFSAGGVRVAVQDGRLLIAREGAVGKFVEQLAQITFSGTLAAKRGQTVLYVTERCVFRLTGAGLALTEIAPGVDLDADILRHLPFRPIVGTPITMDPALFTPATMGLRERMLDINIDDRLSYDAATNTVFMNFAGMRVRSEQDVTAIVAAVDRLLAPLGTRVNAIVNYEGFAVDDEATEAYMNAVQYVETTYYLKVSRFTNSGFLRLKLGKELERRQVSARVFETRREAERNLAGEAP
jgi:acyl CoA:acetate/3-ketoacid CoA transferase